MARKLRIHVSTCQKSDCDCPGIKLLFDVRYLGIRLDSALSWKPHVEGLTLELRKITYSIMQLKNYLNLDQLRLIYISLFQSTLSYGLGIYGGASSSILLPLVRLQRKIIKSILKLPKPYPSEELNKLINVPTIDQLFKIELCKLFPYLSKNFVKDIKNTERYSMRNDKCDLNVKIPLIRYETTKSNVPYNIW